MTRTRTETAAPQLSVRNHSGPTPASPSMATHDDQNPSLRNLPSIRFIPHADPRAPRPSLQFSTITRTIPDESSIIRVGRYSERDNIPEIPPNVPSAAAVGFKSKVVSRKHCELWCKDGSWFIKDVKSSSGTFLNHIRLSQPNVESKPFRLKDGDIIQLGIDFRGGEEMIFRCVKIRIECNRGWQQALNTFNKQTHQRLRNLGKAKKDSDNASTHTSECSICLMSIAPCQSLFVAPCSHVWHYKCIRPILNGSTWPNFLCPNCRAVADLEADVEDMGEYESWDGDDALQTDSPSSDPESRDRHVTPKASASLLMDSSAQANGQTSDLEEALSRLSTHDTIDNIGNLPVPSHGAGDPSTPQGQRIPPVSSSATQVVSINVQSANEAGLSPLIHMNNSRSGLGPDRASECPMTPRNDVGPFVLDGSAGRAGGQRLDDSPSSTSSAPSLPPVSFN
ncbi:FHA domain-containing protein [Massarina eburnea CBS 473.64]|uniref:RING-type E3 ubiquitin transferase n=1 Tax=Massarina eburnea CBS 473.64 TaxID=1395130 RepID=A0A6A6RJ30_9PLEO|nr:FHA domain-containing protein [Massarina eburnea CBS 473.64]